MTKQVRKQRDTGIRLEFRKVSDPGGDKPLTVVAWANVVTKADGTTIEDHDGHRINFCEIEKAFADFAMTGGLGRGGEMHERVGGADIIGQITLNRDERIALGFGPGIEGAIVKALVHDPVLKQRIRSGELSEMSIAGEGEEVPIEEAA